MKEFKEIELIKKVYEDKGRPNNEVQAFALSCLIEYKKQLLLHNVSQQSEMLGCNHDQIRVDGKDVGTCVKCSVKMEKAWQPNCS